ncbi:MAG TPA: hypothetical protein VGN17_20205 [Bryobacteraceae bacterium]|jgi:hypothetical protein
MPDWTKVRVLIGVLFPLFLVAMRLAGEEQPKVLRQFKNSSLVQLSPDGTFILTSSMRRAKCAEGKNSCGSEVLTVYERASGKSVGELSAAGSPVYGIPNRFLTPEFVDRGKVRTIESSWNDQRKSLDYTRTIWDPASKTEQRSSVAFSEGFSYQCPVDNQRLLGLGPLIVQNGRGDFAPDGPPLARIERGDDKRPLQLVVPGGPVATIATLNRVSFGQFKCDVWRSENTYLLQEAPPRRSLEDRFGKSLTWFSIEAGAPPRPCHAFEGLGIRGYAISPDQSRIAVVTRASISANDPIILTVLDLKTCAELNHFELEFPEKPQTRAPLLAPSKPYPDNVPFPDQFASSVAISPDNKTVAVAYGIAKGISGLAFFGVYSMSDGHRMATLKGDTFTPNLYEIFVLDIYSARGAPLDGAIQFSADSKSLFTSSRNLRQWDVSGLR